MNTPDLIPIHAEDLPAPVVRGAVGCAEGPIRWFRVASEGTFDGRTWRVGDVLVVSGKPTVDDQVVLVPAGRGMPKLGHVRWKGLMGDRGEPCDAARWLVAGTVGRVLAGAYVAPLAAQVRAPEPVATSPQLALFGGAAA